VTYADSINSILDPINPAENPECEVT